MRINYSPAGCLLLLLTVVLWSPSPLAKSPVFSLLNTGGANVTEAAFIGKFHLVFFGYRHCQHTCPVSLSAMAQALNMLGQIAEKQVVPVFVSVDSQRADAAALKVFAEAFHPAMTALYGSADDIKKANYEFKVLVTKLPSRQSQDYEISHSSSTYLLDPSGAIVEQYAYGTSASVIAKNLAARIKSVSQ